MKTTRHTVEYRWFCIDKELCDEIDDAITDLKWKLEHMSEYIVTQEKVGNPNVGMESITLTRVFTEQIKIFREHRAKLWRRVRREIDEVVEDEVVSNDTPLEPIVRIHHVGDS